MNNDNIRNIVKIDNFDNIANFKNNITVSNQLKTSQLSWSWADLGNLRNTDNTIDSNSIVKINVLPLSNIKNHQQHQ